MAEPSTPIPTRPSLFAALGHSPYRRFWIPNFASQIGTWMQISARSWLVLSLYNNPTEATAYVGLLGAFQSGPSLILSLFAGAVVDRVPKKTVLLITQSISMTIAFLLSLAVATDRANFVIIAGLSFISGCADAFDITARQSTIPHLVPRELLPNAVALNSLAFNTARILGAALFGIIAPWLGLAIIFALNGLSFIGVIIALTRLPIPQQQASTNRLLSEIGVGLKYVWQTFEVRQPILLLGILSLSAINFQVITPVVAKLALGLQETGYGLLNASFGVGAIAGAIWHVSHPGGHEQAMRRGAILLSCSVALLGLAPHPILAAIALAGAGMSMILFTVSANSSVQLATPDHLRGRVMSVYSLVFNGMTPPGALFVGSLMSGLGPRLGVSIAGSLALVAALTIRLQRVNSKGSKTGA